MYGEQETKIQEGGCHEKKHVMVYVINKYPYAIAKTTMFNRPSPQVTTKGSTLVTGLLRNEYLYPVGKETPRTEIVSNPTVTPPENHHHDGQFVIY